MTKPKLFLLDGSYLAYRSYFAFIRRPLITSRGENTSAVFGFIKSLQKVLREENPDYLGVVFDTPEPTFRHKMFGEYKATREKMPEDLIDQLPRLRQVITTLQIPMIELPGYEADDVMATLAKQAADSGIMVYLLTGDKDLQQLVNDNIWLYRPGRSGDEMEIIDPAWIKKNWQIEPRLVRDVLGLAGDASDNIPGVPSIGEKTAVKLIQQFGSFERLLDHLSQVEPERIRTAIAQNLEQARLSYRLVEIDEAAPVTLDFKQLARKEPQIESVAALYRELEFHSLIKDLQPETTTVRQHYQAVTTLNQFNDLIRRLQQQPLFAFDVETTHTDPLLAELVGFSVCWQEGEAYYVPVQVTEKPSTPTAGTLFDSIHKPVVNGLPLADVLPPLKKILEDNTRQKCGQNIKYDALVMKKYGVTIEGVDFDTMVASYLLNPSNPQHNLDSLSLEYLNYKKVPTSDLLGKGKNQITMREVPLEKISFYAAEDADFTLRLRRLFEPKLKSAALLDLFRDVEIPLIDVLTQMEWNGVALDTKLLRRLSLQLEEEMIQLEQKIYTAVSQQFNLNSPQQLAMILFEKLQLPTSRRTKTGYSTDVDVLAELARLHPVPQLILDYRQLAKLRSTYVDALPRLINPHTGRLHTSYNQAVAATGRLSSSDPNLQNIPIRTELGREIRKAFIPGDPANFILDADYSQIELRIVAHLSGDDRLIGTFAQDLDIHAATAAQIFGIPLEQVNADHRRKAKEINFGIIYGMGKYGLATRLNISQDEAETFINNYFEKYPQVRQFIDQTIDEARKKGYVTTMMNRRRYLPEIHSENRRLREFAERTAINTPIQGTAADLIKVAMIHIQEQLRQRHLRSLMILQVHDELVFEVVASELDEMRQLVVNNMESALKLKVPIKVDIGVGKNWLEAH